jgi:cytochrome c peroxidase
VTAADKESLLGWLKKVRKTHYATAGAPDTVAADVLQPLPLPVDIKADPVKVALGNKLFHDVRLSGDGTLSCASCHGLDKGGTDQAKSSTGIRQQVGPINAPTVLNAVFNVKQFWDGRAADLQEQAGGPVENPMEMGATFAQVIEKLKADAAFVAEFTAVYPEGLSKPTITHAIAEFERTLVTSNSRFDQYLRGKTDALNADELAGLALFRENGCATCHAGKALGGQSFERMGRRADYFADRGQLTDADHGRFSVTKSERDRHAFKVPTLRNIALTFPYFHDGSQQSLEQAVKTMAKYQAYRDFSDTEVTQVVAFLKTLTGELNGKPL